MLTHFLYKSKHVIYSSRLKYTHVARSANRFYFFFEDLFRVFHTTLPLRRDKYNWRIHCASIATKHGRWSSRADTICEVRKTGSVPNLAKFNSSLGPRGRSVAGRRKIRNLSLAPTIRDRAYPYTSWMRPLTFDGRLMNTKSNRIYWIRSWNNLSFQPLRSWKLMRKPWSPTLPRPFLSLDLIALLKYYTHTSSSEATKQLVGTHTSSCCSLAHPRFISQILSSWNRRFINRTGLSPYARRPDPRAVAMGSPLYCAPLAISYLYDPVWFSPVWWGRFCWKDCGNNWIGSQKVSWMCGSGAWECGIDSVAVVHKVWSYLPPSLKFRRIWLAQKGHEF